MIAPGRGLEALYIFCLRYRDLRMSKEPNPEKAQNLVTVLGVMQSLERVEGGWVEATCPRCGWTYDAPTKSEVYMPVVRHISGCMEGR